VIEFFHTRHVCGHAVYWSNAELAMLASASPCPWCGAETGAVKPPEGDDAVVRFFDPKGRLSERLTVFRRLNPDGSALVPPDMIRNPNEPVIIRHRADEACCKGDRP
jgi:hypothetical protein